MSENFIEKIALYIQKYASQYGITVHSPIIAQAVLESASGTSELAVYANNYFGIKYRNGRCPSASGIYYKKGSEQNADGSYSSSVMQWCKFNSMDAGVKGYFDFINTSRYSNLKGITNPQKYLEIIKDDGYATSLKYVQNLMAVIKKYDLTKYDVNNSSTAFSVNNKSLDTTNGTKLYRVQVGAYSKEDNAIAMKSKLKSSGYNCIIKKINGFYKCQVGAFSVEDNARNLQRKLRKLGFDSFIVFN